MAVTLRDIAKKLGLSHATVSFVLNDRRDVAIPESTRERVLIAAKELGYRPNRSARSLVLGRTGIIGVWMPCVRHAFYASMLEAIRKECSSRGKDCLYYRATFDRPSAIPFDSAIDGVIALDLGHLLQTVPPLSTVPIVAICSKPDSQFDTVYIDLDSGIREAVDHLLATNPKKILYVGYEGYWDSRDHVVNEFGLRGYADIQIVRGPLKDLGGVSKAVTKHIQTHGVPDVILCFNHEITMVVAQAMSWLGFTPPNDYRLCGVRVTEMAQTLPISVTSVGHTNSEIARHAIDFLMNRINDPLMPHQSVVVPSRLEIGESTVKPSLSISA